MHNLVLSKQLTRGSIFGDQHDIDRAKHHGVDAMSADDLRKLNKKQEAY